MQNLNFLETEFLDIIFRGKNKNYGAYTLRKFYPLRMRNALLLTGGLLLSFFVIIYFNSVQSIDEVGVTDYIYDEVLNIQDLEVIKTNPGLVESVPETPIEKVPPTEIEQVALVQNTPVDDPHQTDPVPPEGLQVGHQGSESVTVGNGGTDPSGTGSLGGDPSGTSATRNTVAPIDFTPREYAEIMPEFPGGEAAMIKYLRDNTDFPRLADEMGVEGVVYVQFVVNTHGKISKVKVVRGIGAGCDQEASRVVKSMPIWMPGFQDGHKVNVSFVLPIKFEQ